MRSQAVTKAVAQKALEVTALVVDDMREATRTGQTFDDWSIITLAALTRRTR